MLAVEVPMKPLLKSRLIRSAAAIVVVSLTLMLRRYLPAEVAGLLADEVVALVAGLLGLRIVALRASDKRQAESTVRAILDRKAAKAAAKVAPLLLLTGCPGAQVCDQPALVEGSTEPATGVQVVAIRCGSRLLWREACPGAVIRQGWLHCGGRPVVKLTEVKLGH